MDLKLWEDFVLQYVSDQNTTSCALGIEPILKQGFGLKFPNLWKCLQDFVSCTIAHFLALLCLFELLHHET